MSAERVRAGSRVYWHGVFPDFDKKATVIKPGTIRHEVRWDDKDTTSLEYVRYLERVGEHRRCDCGRCGAPSR